MMIAQKIETGRMILGEGPVWREGQLHWVDIERKLFFTRDVAGKNSSVDCQMKPGAAVPMKGGQWLFVREKDLAVFDPSTKEMRSLVLLSTPEHQNVNDAKADFFGRVWFGTKNKPGYSTSCSLFSYHPREGLKEHATDIALSNGMAWSFDRKYFYYVDTLRYVIFRYRYDLTNGAISERTAFYTFKPEEGYPDGLTIDRNGDLWVALWEGSCVVKIDHRQATRSDEIRLPATLVTSCVFGGEDYKTLFISTATYDFTEEQFQQQPDAGSLFQVRLDVGGFAPNLFNMEL